MGMATCACGKFGPGHKCDPKVLRAQKIRKLKAALQWHHDELGTDGEDNPILCDSPLCKNLLAFLSVP